MSNEEVLEKYKYNPEQSLFENGFTKLKCSFEKTFESESGNITVFDYDYCIHGEGLEAVNTIIGQELLDCEEGDVVQIQNGSYLNEVEVVSITN